MREYNSLFFSLINSFIIIIILLEYLVQAYDIIIHLSDNSWWSQ